MNIEIASEVFARVHPKLNIVFLHVRKADNSAKSEEAGDLLEDVEEALRLIFHKETIKNHMFIAPWSVAQQEFGKDAKHYQTSVEHLLKDVLQGKNMITKNTLTNLVRFISLKYIVPLAVDDCAAITGNIQFAVTSGKKKTGVLSTLKSGEVYYHDDQNILGAKLDFWKNSKTLPTSDTTEALIHLEILPPITKYIQKEIVSELKSLVEDFCNAKVKVFVLNQNKRKIKI